MLKWRRLFWWPPPALARPHVLSPRPPVNSGPNGELRPRLEKWAENLFSVRNSRNEPTGVIFPVLVGSKLQLSAHLFPENPLLLNKCR